VCEWVQRIIWWWAAMHAWGSNQRCISMSSSRADGEREEMGLTNSHSHQSTHNVECACRVPKTHPLVFIIVGAHNVFWRFLCVTKRVAGGATHFPPVCTEHHVNSHALRQYAMFVKRHTRQCASCVHFLWAQVNILISPRRTYAERGYGGVFLCVVSQCDKIIERIWLLLPNVRGFQAVSFYWAVNQDHPSRYT
jgi:hypothetical protein